ncbi:MAG: hypothetical protein CBB97_21070 [Candidatus Endolissoclinum sp. TMED37]|nr:MAG: hypothetical protein CBB97_21070 [Candidatus Endolissoclinum sp. TMED37]|tara:strand:+ start:9978 stop:10238 length:261 start_codon:yes stop_codon:yes gene_type:complete
MSEEDLIDLGFKRKDVKPSESGDPHDWHYYTYDFTKSFILISCDSDEAAKEGWWVEFFEEGSDIKFKEYAKLKSLIALIKDAKVWN